MIDSSRLVLIEESIKDCLKAETSIDCSYFLSKELMSGRVLFTQQLETMAASQSVEPHIRNVFSKITG